MEPFIYHGALPLLLQPITLRPGGLGETDTFKAVAICSGEWEKDLKELGFEFNKKIPDFHSLWVLDLDPEYHTQEIVEVTITGRGLKAAGERRKRRMTGGTQSFSIAGETEGAMITTPSGTAERWDILEGDLVISDTYFVTTEPDMSVLGAVLVPPDDPPPPDWVWDGYSGKMAYNHPLGWTLVDRDSEEISKVSKTDGLWRVTDTMVFRQLGLPQ